MRVKTRKPVFLLGVLTFLLPLILREGLGKPAYAQSTTNCLANPVCAEALAAELGSGVAPAVAAPTGTGVSASTLSITTATGTTTTEIVGGVAVIGDMRLTGLAAYYIWNRANNERTQEKAREKYCTANPSDSLCGTYIFEGTYIGTDRFAGCRTDTSVWNRPLKFKPEGFEILRSRPTSSCGGGYGRLDLKYWKDSQVETVVIYSSIAEPPNAFDWIPNIVTNPTATPWKDWSQAKRDEAVKLLSPSDWLEAYAEMKLGGFLQRGRDIIQTDKIIPIPGKDDDPSTPENESLPKKLTGSYTPPNESPSPGSLNLTPEQQMAFLEHPNFERYLRRYTPQQDPNNGCISTEIGRIPNQPNENWYRYATQVSGTQNDYFVLSYSGHGLAYDGLTPNTRNVWEAKYGYYDFFFGFNPRFTDDERSTRLIEWDGQKNEGVTVASECGYNLTWAFSDISVAELAEDRWTQFPPKPRIIHQRYLGN